MNSKMILKNKKQFVMVKGKERLDSVPRFYWSKGNKRQSPSVLVKCGNCDEKVRIYYDIKDKIGKQIIQDDLIEINGVLAHREFWKLLFKKIGLI